MRIFVYEHSCGGMLPDEGPQSLHVEGRAMLSAVLADLAQTPSVDCVTCLRSGQIPLELDDVDVVVSDDPRRTIAETANRADACLIIAPETDGTLSHISRWVLECGGRLLGSSPAAIDVFADKLVTAQRLGSACVPTAELPDLPAADEIVIKPRDGAGALFTVVGHRSDAGNMSAAIRRLGYLGPLVAQPYCPGMPGSIACIGGHATVFLPAVRQAISETGACTSARRSIRRLSYSGGLLPLDFGLTLRARRLAEFVVHKGPALSGYFGIDVIFGADTSGRDDVILEVNPRLTTSFVGYHALMPGRLGSLLTGDLSVNQASIEQARIDDQTRAAGRLVRFHADGTVVFESIH
jgi:predicted ATP-grasp superfamily ATP-dependent carboligase